LHETKRPRRERAILVGATLPDQTRYDTDDSLDELAQLADTAGADVCERITQNLARVQSSTYVGSGKVDELKAAVDFHKADLVIFDDDLTAMQLRNLERQIECKLVDRSGLILDIFATRARTSTAKTQVELAQLDYLRTRLTRQWTHLSRQKGGIGFKGPGESQIETDRRLIGTRMATLRERLDKIDQQRTTQRKGRDEYDRFALVGYTNAGKSTLMNALAGTNVLAENRLFATLDATTRLVRIDANKEVMLSDTVGFIRKLPHRLIESFKSTLDETREADILLHVVDASHPHFEDHIAVVRETLKELGALDKRRLLVFNKMDELEARDMLAQLRADYPEAAFVSALRGVGLDELRAQMIDAIEADFVTMDALVPVAEAGGLIAHIHRVADVLDEQYGYARNGSPGDVAVAQLRFRVGPHHRDDLATALRPYKDLTLVTDESPPSCV
jgi:GTP-binding protein HflX